MLKSKLSAAVLVALAVAYSSAYATGAPQDTQDQDSTQKADSGKAKRLEAVTVTGSLIPQTQVETATPVTTITAQDLKAKGFTTVAEALQQSSFATGAVQGPNASGGFTQTAQTLSIFGLPVGFVKYLIDGRPMGDFPALYNGSDAFNSLSGIPTEMVDHIDILPGGQSSLYGSDAIAGVINIVLKKKLDAPVIDVRYGWHKDGGGADRRVYAADSFTWGKLNVLAGVQFESTQPIWGFDRGLTRQYFQNGTSAPVASRDYLVFSATAESNGYYDPNQLNPGVGCGNVSNQYNGNEAYRFRPNSGNYCGSMVSPGYATLTTDQKTANLYTHATFDVNDNLQLYGDLLYNYDEQKYTPGSNFTFWSTSDYGLIFDPRLNDYVTLQHAFSPEEVGGYKSIMNKNTENSYNLNLGGKGTFGSSNWDYDIGFTHSQDQLLSRNFERFTNAIDSYFQSHVLGPQDGFDPTYHAYPVFSPNYNAFYSPVSNADFRSFTGYISTRSKTWDNMLRAQITNASLFSLPGGDAGLAVVAEGGNQGWDYSPDARILNGDVWGSTDVQGAGHRSRWATTAEFSAPVTSMLTIDLSGRYDDYKVQSKDVSHGTYNIGLEFRPFEMLLIRGKYGTAFKVPTLPDEFQGQSGFFDFVTDYSNCAIAGFTPDKIANCPSKYNSVQYQGTTSGDPNLKPITAKVWNYGFVLAPLPQMSFSVDYYHYNIKNEVSPQFANNLTLQEYQCSIGQLDPASPTCLNAVASITRGTPTDPTHLGTILEIATPKVNVSQELVNAMVANFNYIQDIGRYGKLAFNASYSNVLKHELEQFPGDPPIDELRDPEFSTDFKTKVNGSVTWVYDKWSATVYGNRYGSTPNFVATQVGYGHAGAGKLAPWILYNASVTFNPTDNLALSFLVNNVFNKMPPQDNSYPGTSGTPYDVTNYNVNGRAYYVEATYKFGKTN
jgi:iron complex outermembrane recepter protein